jgi:hypothetical protein
VLLGLFSIIIHRASAFVTRSTPRASSSSSCRGATQGKWGVEIIEEKSKEGSHHEATIYDIIPTSFAHHATTQQKKKKTKESIKFIRRGWGWASFLFFGGWADLSDRPMSEPFWLGFPNTRLEVWPAF